MLAPLLALSVASTFGMPDRPRIEDGAGTAPALALSSSNAAALFENTALAATDSKAERTSSLVFLLAGVVATGCGAGLIVAGAKASSPPLAGAAYAGGGVLVLGGAFGMLWGLFGLVVN